ncbi:MAG TPA: hypothetical protein VGL72_18145, partial [Bryobacteraceae bacterium]
MKILNNRRLARALCFALCFLAGSCALLAQPTNVSVTPSSGTGIGPQTFAFTSSSPNGYADIYWMQIIINYGVDNGGSCGFVYYPASNIIFIGNDAGTAGLAAGTPGTAGTIQNSQCLLNLGASSAAGSGNNLTLNLALTFEAGLPGPQNVYLYTGDNQGLSSGWQQMGTWTTSTVTSQPPTAASVTPSGGGGLNETFAFMASSVNGSSYIMQMYALINSSTSGVGACDIYFNRAGNYVGLFTDAGVWGPYGYLGTAGTIQNSQCTLDTGASFASGAGQNLTLNLALAFNASWAGAKNSYLTAWDRENFTSGSPQLGTWTVGTPAAA